MDSQRPTMEDSTTNGVASKPPDSTEVKRGVELPRKVPELRRKLGQKAKQKPGFGFYAMYDRIYF